MTVNDEFYFALLRVSMLQLLKSIGFDKAKPSTVDIFTDLYIKWLELMLKEINKLSMARQSTETDDNNNIALQDIVQAMINLGQIKPVDILDIYDENPSLPGDKGLLLLKNWCLHDMQLKYVNNLSIPPIEVIKSDLTKKIETIATTKHGFTIGPTKDGPNDNLGTNNNVIPNSYSNMNDYLNKLNPGQTNPFDEDIQKELIKQEELIDEILNNGDTDNWIKFILIRQRLNLWNKKNQNSLPISISQLSSVSGLKNSLLYSMLQFSKEDCDYYSNNKLQTISTKSNNDYLPIISESSISNNGNSDVTYHNESNLESLEGNTILVKKSQEYMQKLPAMDKENRLDTIKLSFENDLFESESESESVSASESESKNDYKNNNGYSEVSDKKMDANENQLKEPVDTNDFEMDDNEGDDINEQYIGNNVDDPLFPNPVMESSNFQFTTSATGNITDETNDVNNLELAAMEDMDNTFQRRQSLDFGQPF